jgi:choline dehydrogenase-like flavoprotein
MFDYVVVGGGTAGCLIASRLAAAVPQCSVLLIEAGRDSNFSEPDGLIPGKYVAQLDDDLKTWRYETVPQMHLNNRVIPYPRGKGLGGSSVNNFMTWVRGPAADYNEWAALVEDPKWAWQNILPVMKSVLNYALNCSNCIVGVI